jgi:ABC-2 type transport system ATP-binding protein
MIQVRGLTKRFPKLTAVDNLDFEVRPGSVTGFLGPNGAGKTTTLRMILGLIRPTAGQAAIDGRKFSDLPNPQSAVGAVLEGSSFHLGRTGRNHLGVLATAGRVPRTRVDEVLELVDLSEAARVRVRKYSMGMRQRLALAAALLADPGALLLDEPANGLDPQGIRWLRTFLRSRADEGRTVLVSSHVLAEVAQTVDRVIVISKGRLLADAPLNEIVPAAHKIRVRTPEPDKLTAALDGHGLKWKRSERSDVLFVLDGSSEAVGETAASAGVPVHEMSAEQPTLEDVFLELTGSREEAAE